jgi:hypothetical protein
LGYSQSRETVDDTEQRTTALNTNHTTHQPSSATSLTSRFKHPMKSPKFQLVPLPLLFVAQQARAFGGPSVLPTAFFQRQWKLRISSSGDQEEFSNRIDEIEAMGGDPFFWSDDDDDNDIGATTDSVDSNFNLLSEMAMSTPGGAMNILQYTDEPDTGSTRTIDPFRVDEVEAMGGDPFFLSDDELESEEQIDTVEDNQLPSLELLSQIMAMSASSGGGATSLLQRLGESASSGGPPEVDDSSSTTVDETGDMLRQVEAVRGGDSSFLSQAPSSNGDGRENGVNEILAMGGDPFFLSDSVDDDVSADTDMTHGDSDDNAYDKILAMGGDPFFLQEDNDVFSKADTKKDSVTPENFDTDQQEDNSLSPMKMLSQMAALAAASQNDGDGAKGILQELGKSDRGHDDSPDSEAGLLEEVEAMGGDPFFLDVPENEEIAKETTESNKRLLVDCMSSLDSRRVTDGQGPTPQIRNEKVSEDDNWEWDGTVDEDAHLDLE